MVFYFYLIQLALYLFDLLAEWLQEDGNKEGEKKEDEKKEGDSKD